VVARPDGCRTIGDVLRSVGLALALALVPGATAPALANEAGPGVARGVTHVQPPPQAARPHENNGCPAACYGQHNQCRIQTKGGPGCDAALTSCLRGCNRR